MTSNESKQIKREVALILCWRLVHGINAYAHEIGEEDANARSVGDVRFAVPHHDLDPYVRRSASLPASD